MGVASALQPSSPVASRHGAALALATAIHDAGANDDAVVKVCALEAALRSDSHPFVRRDCAYALGQIGAAKPSYADNPVMIRCTKALGEALRSDPAEAVQRAASRSLAR